MSPAAWPIVNPFDHTLSPPLQNLTRLCERATDLDRFSHRASASGDGARQRRGNQTARGRSTTTSIFPLFFAIMFMGKMPRQQTFGYSIAPRPMIEPGFKTALH